MKYLSLLLLLFIGCANNPPEELLITESLMVVGCEDTCPDSLSDGSVIILDTLEDFDEILLISIPDTVHILDTVKVETEIVREEGRPYLLCTYDDWQTKRTEWSLDGWVVSTEYVSSGVLRKKNCGAALRK
jgi:hypothetical protein